MASNTTLASLWDEVSGQSSPLRTLQGTPTKVDVISGTEIKDDALKFYKFSGLETMAKEIGILPVDNELVTGIKDQNTQPRQAVQMIAVPIQQSPMKSPFKIDSSHVISHFVQGSPMTSSSPLLLGTPQRMVQATQVVTPKGAQLITTQAVQMDSPQQDWNSGSRKRILVDQDFGGDSASKRKKGEKGGKGLRHFSMKVCEKVQKKGVTSYNEVADELVTEFTDPRNLNTYEQGNQSAYDQKNIRRRVYDALNVLMAMNIISKEKKEIRWIGLPTNSAQECQNLEREKKNLNDRIRYKTQQLQELILQQIAFKNLVERNRQREEIQGAPTSNSAIQLPFIIVNTSKKTVIDCSISNDKYEYLFNFDNTFEIHDDIEVLKRMGMAYGLENSKCSTEDLKKAIKMVPKSLEPYVFELAKVSKPMSGTSILSTGSKSSSTASTSSARYPQASTSQTSMNNLAGTSSFDQSLDAEVALATSIGLSRQSSIGSYSDMPSARESPEEDFSEEESERSSPPDLN